MDSPGRVNEFGHFSFLPFLPFARVSSFCVPFRPGIFVLQLQSKNRIERCGQKARMFCWLLGTREFL